MRHRSAPRTRVRLAASCLAAAALVAGVLLVPGSPAGREGDLHGAYDTAAAAADRYAAKGKNKNAISRAGVVSPRTTDPTTAGEAERSEEYVEQQRALPDPELTTVRVHQPRRDVPEDRYAMANGCYSLQAPDGGYAARTSSGLAVTATEQAGAEPLTFRAADLGVYLLHGTERDFLASPGADWAEEPSRETEWTVRHTSQGRFVFRSAHGYLGQSGEQLTTTDAPVRWRLRQTAGCAAYPESEVNVSGRPHAGVTPYQEVRGYTDAHTHGMAFEFLGGEAHCGRPWHRYGAPSALTDCPDHRTGTNPLEAFLSGEPTHDPVGWPTFKDWPAYNSLTHEGTYYKWMERSWRAGQRLFVNLLVENTQLCKLYPFKRNSCDEMESVRLQARDMYELQDYIDAQYGGPGEGWYRIVTSPWEARRVINQGKLAVVMGIETSLPFGCTYKRLPGGDRPACDAAQIDAQLDQMHRMGVRQMELVNKFDNALAGVAGDAGELGLLVNGANFMETGTFWDMRHCEPADGESADKTQYAAPEISAEQQDALFGAIAKVYGETNVPAVPAYPPPMHCNARGLTDLGSFLVDTLADRGMMIDPDHLSVKARHSLLDQLEARGYPGVLSSHSWSTPDAYPRIYELGGFIAPMAGDSSGFLDKWRRHLGWADEDYYFGFGYGADINGLATQGAPRGADAPDPVTYPFEGFHGVEVGRQHAGERVWDVNVDGVAHYGLYPDWLEDISHLAGKDGQDFTSDMMRGAEAYLQTWERAQGVAADPCRNPENRLAVRGFRDAVRAGMTPRELMQAVGQPWQRLGHEFTYCARSRAQQRVEMTVRLEQGRVVGVRRA